MSVFLVDACRTPIGRYRGALSRVRPDDLAASVLASIAERNKSVPLDAVEGVWFGASNQAGEDNRNVARMASLLAGYPVTVPGATVNRLCGSGMEAVDIAAANLMVGNGDIAIAGGVESMSRAPSVLPKPDEALPRQQQIYDTVIGWRMVNDAMPASYTISMGQTAEVLAAEFEISREAQDCFALRSHERAVAAQCAGSFDAEIVPVAVPGSSGESTVTKDEGPRSTTSLERLAALAPAFQVAGTVTAGNSSGINDGAAACLLATGDALERYNLEPIARVVGFGSAGVEPERMGIGPVAAMGRVLERAKWSLDDLAVVELNEAFAAQALAVLRELPLDDSVVNPLGGAIALGHPLGCSGTRIIVTLAHQLQKLPGGSRGAATMCIGVGQGIATLLERV